MTKHCAICEADFIWANCFQGGRTDLARKVLEVVDLQRLTDIAYCCDKTITNVVLPALHELFAKQGIDVTTK